MLSPIVPEKLKNQWVSFFIPFFFSSSYSFLPFLFLFRLSLDRRDYYIGKRYKGREYHNNYRNITKKYSASKKLNNVALDESRFTDSKYLIKWNIFCGRKRRIRILHPIKRRSSFSFFHIYICVYIYI